LQKIEQYCRAHFKMCTNETRLMTGITKAEMLTAFNGAGYANVRNDEVVN